MKEFSPRSPTSRPRRAPETVEHIRSCSFQQPSQRFNVVKLKMSRKTSEKRKKIGCTQVRTNYTQMLKKKSPATSSSRGPGKVVEMDQALRATQSQSELMIAQTSTPSIPPHNQGDSSVSPTRLTYTFFLPCFTVLVYFLWPKRLNQVTNDISRLCLLFKAVENSFLKGRS